MKHAITKLLFLVLLFYLFAPTTHSLASSDAIKIEVNGNNKTFTQQPILKDGRVLVPFRELFELLGADVKWDEEQKKIFVYKGRTSIELIPGETKGLINYQSTVMDVPPTIINGRTFVPLRFVSEVLGGQVNWNNTTRTVAVNSLNKAEEILNHTLKVSKDITSVAIETDTSRVGMIGDKEIDNQNTSYAEFKFNPKKLYLYEETLDGYGETYSVDNDIYILVDDEQWVKVLPSHLSKNPISSRPLNSFLKYELVNDIEKMKHFSEIFNVSESENHYILNAVVGSNDPDYVKKYLKNALINRDGPDSKSIYDTSEISNFSYTIEVNKHTHLIESEKMNIDFSIKIADGSKTKLTLTIDGIYSDYNKDFEIVIPEDAKKSAIVLE